FDPCGAVDRIAVVAGRRRHDQLGGAPDDCLHDHARPDARSRRRRELALHRLLGPARLVPRRRDGRDDWRRRRGGGWRLRGIRDRRAVALAISSTVAGGPAGRGAAVSIARAPLEPLVVDRTHFPAYRLASAMYPSITRCRSFRRIVTFVYATR